MLVFHENYDNVGIIEIQIIEKRSHVWYLKYFYPFNEKEAIKIKQGPQSRFLEFLLSLNRRNLFNEA